MKRPSHLEHDEDEKRGNKEVNQVAINWGRGKRWNKMRMNREKNEQGA